MGIYKFIKTKSGELLKNTGGTVAVTWAISMTTILFAVGSAYDYAKLSKAKQTAQFMADSMALAASIAIETNNPDRYEQGKEYTLADLGWTGEAFLKEMKGKVDYTSDATLAKSYVTGSYKPSFLAMAPGVTTIGYAAQAKVKYALLETNPASVFFVTDNSNSMKKLDGNGNQKFESLKDSLREFGDMFEDIEGIEDLLRTALYPYAGDIEGKKADVDDNGLIPGKTVDPKWGTIPDSNINQLRMYNGTDSSGALKRAQMFMDGELAAHRRKNPDAKPLQYVILLSDGLNIAKEQCREWEVKEFWVKFNKKNNPDIAYIKPKKEKLHLYNHVQLKPQNYYTITLCKKTNWSNIDSLQTCSELKRDGVTIYSIGYAVEESKTERAQEFLEACATSPEHFTDADDVDELKAAFKKIGESIQKEVIRISG